MMLTREETDHRGCIQWGGSPPGRLPALGVQQPRDARALAPDMFADVRDVPEAA